MANSSSKDSSNRWKTRAHARHDTVDPNQIFFFFTAGTRNYPSRTFVKKNVGDIFEKKSENSWYWNGNVIFVRAIREEHPLGAEDGEQLTVAEGGGSGSTVVSLLDASTRAALPTRQVEEVPLSLPSPTQHIQVVEGRRKKKHEQKEMGEAEPETSAVVAPLQVFLSSTPPQQQQTRTRKTIVFFCFVFFSKSARWLCLHNI